MSASSRPLRAPLARLLAGASAMALTMSMASPGLSQALTNSFEGLSGSSNEPIDIESDVLVVHDKKKLATFKGNVKAVQGTTTLKARELDVHYVGGDRMGTGSGGQTPSPTPASDTGETGAKKDDSDTQITKIEAKGEVVIESEDDQTTTSDWALYDVPAQLVTVGGNVVLTQGDNVLKGDRLVIDLKTGESRFENTGNNAAGGRIRALFMPKGAAKDTKSQGAAPGAGAPTAAKPPEQRKAPQSGMAVDDDLPLELDPLRR